MLHHHTVRARLPRTTSPHTNFNPSVYTLGRSPLGDVFIDKNPFTLHALPKQLQQRHSLIPDTPVYISGDADTRHADMVRILDEVRRVGFTKVAFNVRPATP